MTGSQEYSEIFLTKERGLGIFGSSALMHISPNFAVAFLAMILFFYYFSVEAKGLKYLKFASIIGSFVGFLRQLAKGSIADAQCLILSCLTAIFWPELFGVLALYCLL